MVESAILADRKGTARTYIWVDEQDCVVAYFSLCPHEIRRDILPKKFQHGDQFVIPAILLARLALHTDLQGRGLGSQLLVDVLQRAVVGIHAVGGRYIVVDAIDDNATSFYAHFGFVPTPQQHRLVMKSTTALENLAYPDQPDI